jgi:hypothetical protein
MPAILDVDLSTFCGQIGNIYMRYGLCPPFRLREAAGRWIAGGVPLTYCVEVIERYLGRHAGSCYSGSGDWNFAWLNSLIQATWHERSFAMPPHPTSERLGRRQDHLDDRGAEERQAGRRTPYTAPPHNLNSRPAVGEVSPATPARSTLADKMILLRSSRSRSRGKAQAPSQKKIDIAVAWLRTELANGERESAVVEADALCAGIAPRTYDRARKRLGIISRRVGFGRWAKYLIALPGVNGTPNVASTGAGAA